MNSDPISKKQVYTDRYGNMPAQNQPQGEYDSFDVNAPQEIRNQEAITPESYFGIENGELGSGMADEDLFSGMSEEEYVAHYRNNVAPRNQAEADALMAEMGGQSEGIFEPRQAISDLKSQLRESETKLVLGEEGLDYFSEKIREAENSIGKRNVDPGELQDRIEGIKDELAGAIDEAKSTRQEKIASMKNMVKQMLEDVDHSHDLSESKKAEITENLESLQSALTKSNVNVEDTAESLDDINKLFKKEVLKAKTAEKFGEILGRIPGKGPYQATGELARRIKNAIETDDWTEVQQALDELGGLSGSPVAPFMRTAIQQLVGVLYYGVAGEDEGKLDQLLALIPQNIRESLADLALNPDDPFSPSGLGSDSEKRENAYYGNPTATSERLRKSSIDTAFDRAEDTSTSSRADS